MLYYKRRGDLKGVICMNKKEIFSKNLTSILETLQKSQIEVANAIGVSQQTFNTWCRGIAIPRMDKIQALADYFHIPMSNLVEDCSSLSSSLSHSTSEIVKAMSLYDEYVKASPEIQGMIESLLKLSQSIPPAPELPALEGVIPKRELPHLKKDNDE